MARLENIKNIHTLPAGIILVLLALLLGSQAVAVVNLLPMSILGVTLASNLAVGFVVGFLLAQALRSDRLSV